VTVEKGDHDPMRSLTFSVSYTLGEYLSFVREHTGIVMAEERAKRGKPPRASVPAFVMLFVIPFASVAFFFKKRRMPVCDFFIDEDRIVRTTADGKLVVPWNDVTAIHRYSQGYLVAKKNGAMPLPLRCLDAEQAATLGALVERRELDLRNSN